MIHLQNTLFHICIWLGVRVIAVGVYARRHQVYTRQDARTYIMALLYEGQNHFDRQQAIKAEVSDAAT